MAEIDPNIAKQRAKDVVAMKSWKVGWFKRYGLTGLSFAFTMLGLTFVGAAYLMNFIE